jgi:type I restriction enzyme S subunit
MPEFGSPTSEFQTPTIEVQNSKEGVWNSNNGVQNSKVGLFSSGGAMNKQVAQLLERHFDLALTAPNGIQKLRALILTLAMQGKLVPQDPNDPPARDLLRDIEAEKKRLVKEGKIKVQKPLPAITAAEMPFAVPEGWEWVRFGDVSQHNSGKTLDSGRNVGELRDYITTSNLYWGRFELGNVRQMPINEKELEKCSARKNDLLICEGGEAGRAAVWMLDSEICFQNHIHRVRFYADIDSLYGYRFFEKLNATGEISQYRKGVAISNMSSKALASIFFPLPPLPEQHRIVAKIDQLMTRCDTLEALQAARDQKRAATHASALHALLNAGEADDFHAALQFISNNFSDLYTVRENVAELRKAILQLAVMGKLVPQDRGEPPARELLRDIETEKKRLVKEGKIKAQKPLAAITAEEMPFAVPEGWEWVRFGNITNTRLGKMLDDSKNKGMPKPYLRNTNVQWSRFDLSDVKEMRFENDELEEFQILFDDLLICEGGEPGRCAIWKDSATEIYFQKAIHRARTFSSVLPEYLSTCLMNDAGSGALNRYFTGATIKHFSGEKLSNYVIPLPPPKEQHRIVAKVTHLMTLCDTLEQQITAATAKRSALLDAVVAQVGG